MPRPWPTTPPSERERAAMRDAITRPFWLDTLPAREPHPPLEAATETDLLIVGGGYTGLWAALYAKQLDPSREVLVLEATRCGAGASSRNGGFINASLTHGLSNGLARFPEEMAQLERLGQTNYDELIADLERHGIDAEYEATGELDVALEPHELDELPEEAEQLRAYGHDAEVLDGPAVRAEVASPTYLGGLWQRSGAGLLNPAKLADGLRVAALAAGVQIAEHSPVRRLSGGSGGAVTAVTGAAVVSARRALLATSAYPAPVRTLRRYIAPVYDYVLMTEPLGPEQLSAIGWKRRQGIGDRGNQFHYYRLSAENRLLFGGYDAVYRFGGPVGPELDADEATFGRLAQHLHTTFPMLEGVRITHRWGGAIDTCSRFSVFFGRVLDGRAAYALGYTGLGVGATRFGARTALDLLDGRASEASATRFVRSRPLPFPPEPLRAGVIALTRNRLAAADRNAGRRGLWLRALDRAGLGFDS